MIPVKFSLTLCEIKDETKKPHAYKEIGGLRGISYRLYAKPTPSGEITPHIWQNLLKNSGERKLELTAEGIFSNSDAENLIKNAFIEALPLKLRLTQEIGEKIESEFIVKELLFDGEFGGERLYQISLENTGEVNFSS